MVKSRQIPEFILPNSNLIRKNFDLQNLHTETNIDTLLSDSEDEQTKEPQVVERDIRVEKLKPGMIVAQNIVTKTGVLIVRQDNKLDDALVENIKYLASQGLLPKEISIYVIPPPHQSTNEGK